MPRVPFESVQLAPLRLPRMDTGYRVAPAEFIGRGLEELSTTVRQVQDQYDVSVGQKAVRDINAGMQMALTETALNFPDPDEFEREATAKINEVQKQGLETAPNPRVKNYIYDQTSDNLIQRKRDIFIAKNKKKVDIAEGNFLLEEERMSQDAKVALSKGDEGLYNAILETYTNDLATQIGLGIHDQKTASQRLLKFKQQTQKDGLALYAAQKPDEFSRLFDSNDPKLAKYDAEDLQRSSEIADRVINTRMNVEKEANRRMGIAAERDHIEDAKNHKLDFERLANDQIKHDWSEEKVNRIKTIHYGLKTSEPSADLLISNAMDPANQVSPTQKDIDKAYQNLLDISDKVSTDSVEYKRAVAQLRNQKRSLNISGAIEQNTARAEQTRMRTKAKQRFNNFLDRTEPDIDTEERRQERGRVFGEIESAPADQAEKIVEQFEKSRKTDVKDRTKQAVDRAKGLLR